MALKLVDGNNVRVPGGAMPEAQSRPGTCGKLDRMSFSKFQRLPLCERNTLISQARDLKIAGTPINFKQIGLSKGDIKDIIKTQRLELVEQAVDTASSSIAVDLTPEQKKQANGTFISIVNERIESIYQTKENVNDHRDMMAEINAESIMGLSLLGALVGGVISIAIDNLFPTLIGVVTPIIIAVIVTECGAWRYKSNLKKGWARVAQEIRDATVSAAEKKLEVD